MTGRYAANTTVSVESSKSELERTLKRYGAEEFVTRFHQGGADILCKVKGRFIRFHLDVPPLAVYEVMKDRYGWAVGEAKARKLHDQEERRLWRVLILIVKSRFEAVQEGAEDFDTAFLPYFVLPNNQTVAEAIGPMIEDAAERGTFPDIAALFEVRGPIALPPPKAREDAG